MRSQAAHTASAAFVFVRHTCASHKIVTRRVTMGKRAKDFKSKANIKFYYVKLRFPMCSLAAHTACAAFCFSKGNNQKHLTKLRILLAQPCF